MLLHESWWWLVCSGERRSHKGLLAAASGSREVRSSSDNKTLTK